MKSLKIIGIGSTDRHRFPPEEFWKKYDAGEFGKPAAPAQPIATLADPAFQQWVKDVAALPAEKQMEAVAKKLMELNPGFDGKVEAADLKGTPKIEKGVVTELRFSTNNVTDISPVRAFVGLTFLNCGGSDAGKGKLSDLSPLQGMPLTKLQCGNTQVSDLSPLQGMKLTLLICGSTKVSDLSPLKGMPLTAMFFSFTQVSDLSPLRGMRLTEVACGNTRVSDLSPLAGMNLTKLVCYENPKVSDLSPLSGMNLTFVSITPRSVTKGLDVIRQMKSLKTIGIGSDVKNYFPPEEFWKKYDAGEFGKPITTFTDPAFIQWTKDVAALPAEKQVEAVIKKLQELNPGFDGKVTPKIEKGAVTDLTFSSDNVTDISPVRALQGLKTLNAVGSNPGNAPSKGILADLSPLQGMPLTTLKVESTQVSDLSPLEGMPLKVLWCNKTQVSDLSPLKQMKLTLLNCGATKVADLSPLKGMPLTNLKCYTTQVSDLSPLQGMSLTILSCGNTKVTDLSPLTGMPTLVTLDVNNLKVTAESIATLKKALPNCKIEWPTPGQFYGQPAAAQPSPGKEVGAAVPAKLDFPDIKTPRELAEWTLRVGGRVNAGTSGIGRDATAEEIAAKDFKLTAVRYDRLKAIDDDAIARMIGWPLPSQIGLPRTSITDAGLRQLAVLKHNSLSLAFNFTNVTGAGFDAFAGRTFGQVAVVGCPISREGWTRIGELKLTEGLYAGKCKLTDDLLIELIGRQPNLLSLHIHDNPLTDVVLEPISRLTKLRSLYAYGTGVTDAGLANLEKTKTLAHLRISSTKVTAAGVAKLQQALPKCMIEWDGAKAVSGKPTAENTPAAGDEDEEAVAPTGPPPSGPSAKVAWWPSRPGAKRSATFRPWRRFPPDRSR